MLDGFFQEGVAAEDCQPRSILCCLSLHILHESFGPIVAAVWWGTIFEIGFGSSHVEFPFNLKLFWKVLVAMANINEED